MFKNLRLKKHRNKIEPTPVQLTADWFSGNPDLPATLKQISFLPEAEKKRIYPSLIPSTLLTRFDIDPISWKSSDELQIILKAKPQTGEVCISIVKDSGIPGEIFD